MTYIVSQENQDSIGYQKENNSTKTIDTHQNENGITKNYKAHRKYINEQPGPY